MEEVARPAIFVSHSTKPRDLPGDRRYTMQYYVSRRDADGLPVTRFGLEALPVQPDDQVVLAGRFTALTGLWAWVFLELADLVRLAARQPPRYEVPLSRSPA